MTYEVKGVRISEDGRREDCTIVFRDAKIESSFTIQEALERITKTLSPDVLAIVLTFASDHSGDDAAFFLVTISDQVATDLAASGRHERFHELNRKLMDAFYCLDLDGRFPCVNFQSASESRRAA